VVALLDKERSKAELVAKKFKVHRYFNQLEDFLKEPLDVISICTPPQTHTALIEAAITTGRHVLVEKPMALQVEEGKRLEVLARDRGVTLCPAHNFLFSRSAQKAEALLQEGKIGEVRWAMAVQFSSWRRRLPDWFDKMHGGIFFDEAPHLLYLLQHFLGQVHIEQAWHNKSDGDPLPKTERIEARLQGAKGTGYLNMWFGAPFSEWLFILCCSRAVLVLDLFRDILIHLPPEHAHKARDILKSSMLGTYQLWQGIFQSGMRLRLGKLLYGHDRLVQRFLDAVAGSREPPLAARDGWEVVALMEEILRYSEAKD